MIIRTKVLSIDGKNMEISGHTLGGTILQMPWGSASGLIFDMYSSGPKANSSPVG